MILQTDHAAIYANRLLTDLGVKMRVGAKADHPALAWRRSGLLQVTGAILPLPLASHADGALMALAAVFEKCGTVQDFQKCGSQLLGERAHLRGLVCQPAMSAGGAARLLQSKDGQIALNLTRSEDWELLPAWLETEVKGWDDIQLSVQEKSCAFLVERGAELGLAVAHNILPSFPKQWIQRQSFAASTPPRTPLIVDLSSLWAGPLASQLLAQLLAQFGAQVIKVESPNRPDGMRRGNEEFYARINAGKDCVAVDFKTPEGLKALQALLTKADIVIEASRPRALAQLGIIGEDFVRAQPGKIWARLSAYGRTDNRIGFGDDIGVSAGLSSVMQQTYDAASFVGDAIADPVAGLHLALAIGASFQQGGGVVIDVSMRDILRTAMGDVPTDLKSVAKAWQVLADKDKAPLYEIRRAVGAVKNLGADNAAWLC